MWDWEFNHQVKRLSTKKGKTEMLYFLPIPQFEVLPNLFKVDSSHPGPQGCAPNYRAAVITEPVWRERKT